MNSHTTRYDDHVIDNHVFTQCEQHRSAIFRPLAAQWLIGHHTDQRVLKDGDLSVETGISQDGWLRRRRLHWSNVGNLLRRLNVAAIRRRTIRQRGTVARSGSRGQCQGCAGTLTQCRGASENSHSNECPDVHSGWPEHLANHVVPPCSFPSSSLTHLRPSLGMPDGTLTSGMGCHPSRQKLFLQSPDPPQREALESAADDIAYRFPVALRQIAVRDSSRSQTTHSPCIVR